MLLTSAFAVLLLFPLLGTIPGLHADEAWAGLRAHEILNGGRPMIGMNPYTGPLHQFLLAPLLHLLGFTVDVLRLPTAVFSVVSLWLFYFMLRRWFDTQTASLSVIILVTLPFFTGYGRIAHEVLALNPVLALCAILLLTGESRALNNARSVFLRALLAGVWLGLGVWNHAIFLSIPFALFVTACFRDGTRLFHAPGLSAAWLGFMLVIAPRVLWEFSAAALNWPAVTAPAGFVDGLLERAREWPMLIFRIAHGDVLFQRFSGEVLFATPNLVCPFVLAGGFFMLKKLRIAIDIRRSPESGLFVFSVALFLGTLVLCPANADRYFLLPLYLVPIFAAYLFRELLNIPVLKIPSFVLLCLFVLLQVTRIEINYFAAQACTRGRCSSFLLGSKPETSNHFIRIDQLYQGLVRAGARHVYAEFFIALPLRFYDVQEHRLDAVRVIEGNLEFGLPASNESDSRVVTYAAGIRRISPEQFRGFTPVSADSHFIILRPKGMVETKPTKAF